MLTEAKSREIGDAIKEHLSGLFQDVKIHRVDLHHDLDFDGDEILRVYIAIDGMAKDIDTELLAGVYRYILPVLDKFETGENPLISFVSRQNADRRAGLYSAH